MNNFGSALAQVRKRKQLSQRKLADLSGMTVLSIQRYEHGERLPDKDTAERLYSVLQDETLCAAWNTDQSVNIGITAENQLPISPVVAEVLRITNSLTPEGQDVTLKAVQIIAKIPDFIRKD